MTIKWIRTKVKSQEYDLSAHAHRERQEEEIAINEIEKILQNGVIIEKYSNDPRGESCLIAGIINKQALHVVCGKRSERLLIVTVYRPKSPTWINFKTRRKELISRE